MQRGKLGRGHVRPKPLPTRVLRLRMIPPSHLYRECFCFSTGDPLAARDAAPRSPSLPHLHSASASRLAAVQRKIRWRQQLALVRERKFNGVHSRLAGVQKDRHMIPLPWLDRNQQERYRVSGCYNRSVQTIVFR